jgi:hypothetical protein
MLSSSERGAHIVLVDSALLVHRLRTSEDPLKGHLTRCKELVDVRLPAELCWSDGRLDVRCDYGDLPYECGWVSSVREC